MGQEKDSMERTKKKQIPKLSWPTNPFSEKHLLRNFQSREEDPIFAQRPLLAVLIRPGLAISEANALLAPKSTLGEEKVPL